MSRIIDSITLSIITATGNFISMKITDTAYVVRIIIVYPYDHIAAI